MATSKQTPDIEIEFYWTTIFGLDIRNVHVLEPGINHNVSALMEQMRLEDIDNGTPNNTHALFHKYLNKMKAKTTAHSQTNSATLVNSRDSSTTRKSSVNNTLNTTVDALPEQLRNGVVHDIPSTLFENGSHIDSETSSGENSEAILEQTIFKSEPLKRLKKLLALTPTEVPDLVILGEFHAR